ncbi:zinc finger MYM-type protein 1-like [Saccostrea cucullata]|uniref:zinc finger MYM-type protein 1-like n=1 Tax=Saccostrea cuccullata TaxID=36930 RepID=UPI002ED3D3FB
MMSVVQECAFAFHYSAKRLEAFFDELQDDEDVKEAMDRKTKLKSLCETRWISRSDALTTFKTAFPVVVHTLEHLVTQHDDKAAIYLSSILRFDFIVGLVACEHILRLVVHLSFFLQDPKCDMLSAIEECRIVLTQLNDARNDQQVWDALFEESVSLADQFDVEPTMPRRAGRQQNRANIPAVTPSEYWRKVLFYVFIDHLVQQLEDRLLGAEQRFQAFFLLPSKIQGLTNEKVLSIFDTFKTDVVGNVETFRAEVERWKVKWQMHAVVPSSIVEVLDNTNSTLYPSISAILMVLLTMPVATATVERSFSVLKRVKTYLSSTINQERLSSLALLHIHRDVPIEIDAILNDFAAAKSRKWKFF